MGIFGLEMRRFRGDVTDVFWHWKGDDVEEGFKYVLLGPRIQS